MAGYTYKGTQRDVKPEPAPSPTRRGLCGTRQGEWKHRYLGEPQCDKCREAANADRRDNYHATKGQPPKLKRMATIEKLEQAKKLFENGASQQEVQRKTGMSRTTIRRYFPGQGWTHKQAAEYGNAKRGRSA